SSFGGIVGGILGICLFFRLRVKNVEPVVRLAYLDVVAYVFPIALMVGRVACSMAHDHPGTVTMFPLAVSLRSAEARDYITHVYADAGRVAELPGAARLSQVGFH